jgi:methionine synthase II (cobalamin-independent)
VPSAQPALYPAYEAALAREIEQITAAIPADDLAIQFDLATEFAFIEQVSLGGGPLTPWFAEAGADADSIIAGCVVAASRVANLVPAGVQLGFHLCYGDVAEKHFVEPSDTANLVAVANGLTTGVTRRIDWVHLPVPIERDDSDYFVPLAALNLRAETDLFLGVVHHEDGVAGAHRRLEAAEPALTTAGIRQVGIATECGFGRGPQERTVPLLDLHAEILSTLGAKH